LANPPLFTVNGIHLEPDEKTAKHMGSSEKILNHALKKAPQSYEESRGRSEK